MDKDSGAWHLCITEQDLLVVPAPCALSSVSRASTLMAKGVDRLLKTVYETIR